MVDVAFERDFRTALRIDEPFLRRLHAILSDFMTDSAVEVALETDGNLTITSNDLEEVLTGDLIQADTIKKISMRASKYDREHWLKASFDIVKDANWRTCSVRLHGPSADQVVAFKSRVEGLIRSGRLWYSLFRPHGPGGSMAVSFTLCALIYSLGWAVLVGFKLIVFENGLSFAIPFVGTLSRSQ